MLTLNLLSLATIPFLLDVALRARHKTIELSMIRKE
jgi:uncharacterized membrane protein